MTLVYGFFILIIFPISSWAFSCRYNDSAVVLRKTVLLELENHNYIHIRNATFDIRPKSQSFRTLVNRNVYLIENISFKGFLSKGDDSKYVEVILNNLKSYRYNKHDGICRVSYQESKSERSKITSEQEAAITRLAESCIQSRTCGIDLMEIDEDSDLYFQSTQSALNGLVDFYIPKLLKNFILAKDGSFKIPTVDISNKGLSLYVKDGVIKGLDTLQRTNDIVIHHEKSKYNISLSARFSELDVALHDMKVRYHFVGTSGDLKAMLHGISLKANVIIDVQSSTCKILFDDPEVVSFKSIKFNIPVWGWFNVPFNFNSKKLWFFEKPILNSIFESIPEFNFDCKKYVDKLADLI